MQQSGMTVVTTTTSYSEAQVVEGLLASSGVTCEIEADDGGRTNPEFDLTRFVRVLVRDEDAEAAREILRQAQENGLALPAVPDVESGL